MQLNTLVIDNSISSYTTYRLIELETGCPSWRKKINLFLTCRGQIGGGTQVVTNTHFAKGPLH